MDPVVILDATMTVGAARSTLASLGPTDRVVVRRRDPRGGPEPLWYPLSADDLARVLNARIDPATPLATSLDLHEHGASPVRQLDHPDVTSGRWTGLVVDGSRAVGWTTAIAQADGDRGPTRGGLDLGPPANGGPPTSGAEPDEAPTESATPTSAYPRVDVPGIVDAGASFDVVVGLSKDVQPGMPADQQAILIARATRMLDVQIKAESFTVGQVRHTLEIDHNDLEAHTVTIPVTAPVVTQDWRGRIEIEYGADGMLIGTAWRDVVVSPGAASGAPASTQGGDTAVNLSPQPPIDLTVSISRGQADDTFLWTFTTPHAVALPDEQVITHLDSDTAETFALRKVREMSRVDGSPTAELKVTGVAREIGAQLPLWFWQVLAAVWRVAKDAGRLPTLLLVSQESLVPWELATTEEDYIVDRSLVDAEAPQLLGAQWAIGRWRPAGPETPSRVRRPGTTPVESLPVAKMVIVVGQYGPESRMKALEQAIAEGRKLNDDYTSLWVDGTDAQVSSLLLGTLTDRGEALEAQVLHVAAHGEVDPNDPKNDGIILSNSAVRIDESIVSGSTFTRTAQPLVFLNCCQLGSPTTGALIEGGLAAAFLTNGARAFVAPLWNVNDGIAKDTALAFYDQTINAGRPVGEVMRELRARFTTAFPNHDQTTPLAYAYYGHPGLVLSRQEKP